MFFLRRRFSSESSATHSFKVAHLLAQAFNLARGRLAPGVAGEPLLARFQKLFRPAVIQTLGDALAAAQGGDLSSPRRPDTTIRIFSSALYCLRVLRRISRTVPFGYYDETEILRYAITSICPKGADVRHTGRRRSCPARR